MARGPFVLWGDPRECLIRGDFYGPDGGPVASVKADSSGLLVYFPEEEYASFMPGGMQVGGGTIPVRDLLHLLRTGYPLEMEVWQIVECAEASEGRIQWRFITADSLSRMVLSMDSGDIFPGECVWEGGRYSIIAASPHDEYRAWPWKWIITIGEDDLSLELTEVNLVEVPNRGIWNLVIPVPVDTLDETPVWSPAKELMVR